MAQVNVVLGFSYRKKEWAPRLRSLQQSESETCQKVFRRWASEVGCQVHFSYDGDGEVLDVVFSPSTNRHLRDEKSFGDLRLTGSVRFEEFRPTPKSVTNLSNNLGNAGFPEKDMVVKLVHQPD